MEKTNKAIKAFTGNSEGISLIEVVIALAILGIVAAAFLGGLGTSYKGVTIASERTNAESLTRSEFEYIKNSVYRASGFSYEIPAPPGISPPWDPSRTTLDSHYTGYSVTVTGVPIDPSTHNSTAGDLGMQQITVKVYHQDKLVLTTSSYKVSR